MNQTALYRASLGLLAGAFLAALPVSALVEVDRGVIILTTQFDVSYDSNILGRSNGDGDTLLKFAPSLEFRREGRGVFSLNAGANVVTYTSESSRNHEDYNIGGMVTVPVSPDSPLSGGLNASFARATTVDQTVSDLVTSKRLNLGANGAYAVSERLSGSAGISWGDVKNEGFGDNESLSLSVGLAFQELVFRRLPLNLSYSYSASESTNDVTTARKLDTTSHSFNVGTSGQLTPKVTGNLSAGLRSTDDSGFGPSSSNDTGVVASASLSWAADDLTNVGFGLSKSLDITADNESTDTTSVSLTWSRKLSEQMSANAGISNSWNSYRRLSRDDRTLGLNAGLSYQIRRNWSAAVNYRFTDNSSDFTANNFERHLTSFSVTGRF